MVGPVGLVDIMMFVCISILWSNGSESGVLRPLCGTCTVADI